MPSLGGEFEEYDAGESYLMLPEFSDEAIASIVSVAVSDRFRYLPELGKWMIYDGARWQEDKTLEIERMVRKHCVNVARHIMDQADVPESKRQRLATDVCSVRKLRAVGHLARSQRQLVTRVSDWDADPWTLNTPSGQVYLCTGEVLEHDPYRYHTRMTRVGPAGKKSPLWEKLLKQWTNGDDALAHYLQRFVGYALTGVIRDHVFLFLYGLGANGKSTFLNALREILGDYCVVAPMETFMQSGGDRHPTELAMLRGARLVIAQEVERRRRWASARIKGLVGGDPVTARLMRQDFFTFEPNCKLILAGNHRPRLDSVDEAMRRRLQLVPFTATIPKNERDPAIPDKLRAEYPGILRWAIEGCMKYLDNGLNAPEVVTAATAEYFSNEDVLGQWVEEAVEQKKENFVRSRDLYTSYRQWASDRGEYVMSEREFVQTMEERGYIRGRESKSRIRGFKDVRLKLRKGDTSDLS